MRRERAGPLTRLAGVSLRSPGAPTSPRRGEVSRAIRSCSSAIFSAVMNGSCGISTLPKDVRMGPPPPPRCAWSPSAAASPQERSAD